MSLRLRHIQATVQKIRGWCEIVKRFDSAWKCRRQRLVQVMKQHSTDCFGQEPIKSMNKVVHGGSGPRFRARLFGIIKLRRWESKTIWSAARQAVDTVSEKDLHVTMKRVGKVLRFDVRIEIPA